MFRAAEVAIVRASNYQELGQFALRVKLLHAHFKRISRIFHAGVGAWRRTDPGCVKYKQPRLNHSEALVPNRNEEHTHILMYM